MLKCFTEIGITGVGFTYAQWVTFGGIREILDDNGATYTQHSEINTYTTQMLQDVPTDIYIELQLFKLAQTNLTEYV